MAVNPLDIPPDNQTVQSAAICYGGRSFPEQIKMALLCHLEILKNRHPVLRMAPELLASLERVCVYVEAVGLIPPCVREARKIITQAKGE